jgi:hypothetical protein
MALPVDNHRTQVRRMDREEQTVSEMVTIFCQATHTSGRGLCRECKELLDYAICRLARCPFGAEKPTCAKCPVHCYKPAYRDRIREVMKFAGPQMLLRHPASAVRHLLDKMRSGADAAASE